MRCPRCSQEGLSPYAVCARCGFSGAPGQVEDLAHVAYLLGELETWREIGDSARDRLRTRYLNRRRQLEVDLGLRQPPLTAVEAHKLQWELFCLGELQEEVAFWLEQGWVHPEPAERLRQGANKRAETLRRRLVADAHATPGFSGPRDRLKLLDYLEQMAGQAWRRGHFVDDQAYAAARADIQADRRELEIEAGLRRPERVPAPAVAPAAEARRPPRPPRAPLTWDRIWQTLLSERTLNVLLFLGAFLLVASATTYVLYNWEKLPAAAQLAFIVLFTLSFYSAGWFLRVRMDLRASGIAVTAVGSLLVPLDFYAVFVAGEVVPAAQWPWVWLAASAVCLPVYTFTARRIQAGFFGYLVAVAAGNLLCAALQVMGIPREWFLAGLVALALGLATLAYRLNAPSPLGGEGAMYPSPGEGQKAPSPLGGEGAMYPSPGEGELVTHGSIAPSPSPSPVSAAAGGESWAVLSAPLRFSALMATAVILPLGFGLAQLAGVSSFDMEASLAGAWTLGAILFGYAAAREHSALLSRAAATALPVALSLVLHLVFDPLSIKAQWHALGWAILAMGYLWAGRRWSSSAAAGGEQEAVARLHRTWGRTATGWGLALMLAAAVWSPFNLWAAAATYATLTAGAALAIYLWHKPRVVPAASLLAFSSMTFAMAAGHLEPAELCLGWALLAVLHILAALRLRRAPDYASRLFAASLLTGLLALLPPTILHHEPLLTYVLGHWIGLALWLLWLDHRGEDAGLTALLTRSGPLRWSALHWAIALPLPFFATMLYTRFRAPDAWLGFMLAVLGWAWFGVGELGIGKLGNWAVVARRWSFPWYVVGYGCSVAAPVVTFYFYDQALLGTTILVAAGLYLVSAWAFRHDVGLIPGGLALPLGLLVLLDYWAVPWPQQSVVLAAVAAAYLLGGTWLERRRGVPPDFMASLGRSSAYAVAHLVALAALFWGLEPAAEHLAELAQPGGDLPWPDSARLWAAGGQLLLGVTYGLFAWFREQETWAHIAAWLGVLAGGLIATAYSQGRGSSALKAALLAVVYVLAERALASRAVHQRWAGAGRAWSLYHRPLLIAGWCVSAGAIGLALVRNLVLLGGGFTREVWAIAGLLTVTALYAASAWMFRRRIFLWFAGALVVIPWTQLTLWGWFLWPAPPPLPRYALSWAILACLQLAVGQIGNLPNFNADGGPQSRGSKGGDFGFPLRAIANLLLPFALFWAVADAATSSIAWGLGLAFYLASAVADHRRGLRGWRAARFLYPAVAVGPVWAIYLLNHFAPAVPYETYGLLLLALALPLLAAGRRLRMIDSAHALPLYLGAYGVAIVGTLLVAHQEPLLAAALTFDALLCVLSAWLFREPLWGYPAAALAPAALLVALAWSVVPAGRRGWWLIGLGVLYLVLAWALRQARRREYATAPLAAAFAVVALGLPPSSLDDVGAFWGYLGAAAVYALAAAWLRQPLLLTPTAALLAVPYSVAVVNLGVAPADYGLAIFPGVAAALAVAHLLDRRLRRPAPLRRSLLEWWAGPFYAWAYVGALAAVGLALRPGSGQAWNDSARLAIALGLAALTFLHATWRFRSRAFLLLAGALAQGAALAVIDVAGWLAYPAWAALAFLPVTVVTAGLGLVVERRRGEGAPLGGLGIGKLGSWELGWSRVLYVLLAVDLVGGQVAASVAAEPGAVVTAGHALLLGLLATVWAQPALPLVAVGLGVVGIFQGLAWTGVEATGYPVVLALLALGYGLLGYGARFAWREAQRARIWFKPLEWVALGLSAVALLWTVGAGFDVARLVVRTFLGHAVTFADYAAQVRMVMWVLALSGLLYLATAVVRRRYALVYGAVALLLGAWALWWRFFLNMPQFQWYAVPAGLYLLAVGWFEWRQGRRALARWVDRAGMLAWLGTAWWQSLPGVMPSGWPYALLLGAESLLLVWWGSARRMKQFLYTGAAAVVLNAVTQAIEPLLTANRWIVFGIAGALLVGLAILVERKLEAIRELSAEMRLRLEGWE
jgi:hypothetical protein